MKESIIQKGIMDYLRWKEKELGLYYFRANSGSFQTQQGRYVKTGRAGLPDIVCIRGGSGKFIGIEVKNEKGRQSPAQKVAQAAIENAGGEYYIVRSIGDVKRIFEP